MSQSDVVSIKTPAELSAFVRRGLIVTTSEHVLVVNKSGRVFCRTCGDLSGISVALARQLQAAYTGRFPISVRF